jgi:hypothetical protein
MPPAAAAEQQQQQAAAAPQQLVQGWCFGNFAFEIAARIFNRRLLWLLLLLNIVNKPPGACYTW